MRAIEPIPSEFVSQTVFYDYKDHITQAMSKVKELSLIHI